MINHSALNIIYLTETKKNILQPAAALWKTLPTKNARHPYPDTSPPQKPATSNNHHSIPVDTHIYTHTRQIRNVQRWEIDAML